MQGKYFLDEIDNVIYSTDNYSLFNWYNILFFEETMKVTKIKEFKKECKIQATKEAWQEGLKQEKEMYEKGYKYKNGRWVRELQLKGD